MIPATLLSGVYWLLIQGQFSSCLVPYILELFHMMADCDKMKTSLVSFGGKNHQPTLKMSKTAPVVYSFGIDVKRNLSQSHTRI